jgi:hypothetical protein
MIYEIYTSAPKDYDGFSTETVAVVGHCTRSGNPVRKVRIEDRDFEWQTARYASGNNRYTNDRMTFLDYVKFGDWVATPEPTPAPIPEITPEMTPARKRRDRKQEQIDELTAERDALLAQVAELKRYLDLPKFQGSGNDYVQVQDILNRLP